MTDGLENASREWAHPQVKQLIEKQTNDYQWQFLYLGADQDAIEVGMSIGVGAGHSVTYGRGKVKQAMAATAASVTSYRQARAAGMPAPAAAAMSGVHRGAASRRSVGVTSSPGRRSRAAGGSPYTPASRAAWALRSCLTKLSASTTTARIRKAKTSRAVQPAVTSSSAGTGSDAPSARGNRATSNAVTMSAIVPLPASDQGSGVTPAKRSSSGTDVSTWLVTSS